MRPAAFDAELIRHHASLKSFALRLCFGNRPDAEDLMQDTARYALQRWRSYIPGRCMRTWLAAIMRNARTDEMRCRERYNGGRGHVAPLEDDPFPYVYPVVDGERRAHNIITLSQTMARINNLPGPLQRQSLSLLGKGYSRKEAAEICGSNTDLFRNALWKGQKKLLRQIAEEEAI
jgi:RNA polymerase sigma factor (sigma-70 family)